MEYPSWDTFKANCAGNTRTSFECLARLLFKLRFQLGEYLPYYKNHPGNETSTIKFNNEEIGFQAKFFDTSLSSGASQIIHSLEEARQNNPNQTKIIIYTNKEFGAPRKKKETEKQNTNLENESKKKIENKAKELGLSIEWMFGDNILDAVSNNELIYDLFFNPNKDLTHFSEHIYNANNLYAKTIHNTIKVNGEEKIISREEYFNQVEEKLALRHHCLITGNAGCGKSAIVKTFFDKHKDANPLLYINASYFDSDDVNSIFHLEKSYTLGDFREYYKDSENKYIIIDSAEKVLAFKNHLSFSLFVSSLSEDGWIFIFTIRNSNNLTKDFQDYLASELSIECDIVNVPLLTDDELNTFLRENNISKPYKSHFVAALHNLFFLARYTEIPKSYSSTLEQFRLSIWDKKIRGKDHETPAMQDRREQCLLRIVELQLKNDNYIVDKGDVDIEAANELIEDEILSSYRYLGYYVNHDLYVDMANVVRTDIAWNRYHDDVINFVNHIGSNQYNINSFISWITEKDDISIFREFANVLPHHDLNNKWKEAILIAILKSQAFLDVFYKEYENIISVNGYKLFGQLLNVLKVDCQQIEGYIKYKGEDYPLMRPIGKCWDMTVNYLCNNFEAIREKNGNSAISVLMTYPYMLNADTNIKRKAGLVMLKPHEVVAKSRINKNPIIDFQDKKSASKGVYLYCDVLIPELQKIFVDVVNNQWTDNHDPYYELSYDIIMAKSTSFNLYSLYYYLPKEIFDLYELFWTNQNRDKHRDLYRSYSSFHVAEEAWGLSKEMSLRNAYFPPSAFQTGIEALLHFHPKETLEFLIKFIDERTKIYVVNNILRDSIVAFEYKSIDGKSKYVVGSISTWCLYRGTTPLITPYLLQSIHMALERHLLEKAKSKESRAEVKEYLDMILRETSSLSLIAIVVSLCEAYPDIFLEETFIVVGNLQFLKLDKMRLTHEINANTSSFMYYREQQMLEERQASAKLTHRKFDLESILFNMQIVYDNSSDKHDKGYLQRAYNIVDDLKRQWKEEPEDERELSQFTLSRIDVRSMEKQDVNVNGKQGIIYKPHMTKEQEAENERTLSNSQRLLRGANVRAWIDFRFKENYDKAKDYEYDNNPTKAIEIAKDVLRELKDNPNGFYLLPGDEFIPPLVGATLIRDYSDKLSDTDYNFCVNILLDSLEDVNYIFSSSMSELHTQLTALPVLVTNRPDLSERCAKIFSKYASIQKELSGNRCCDLIAVMIFLRNLWTKIPTVLKLSVDIFLKEKSKDGNVETLSISDAESLLCLIPIGSVKGEILQTALICLEKISHYWEPKDISQDINWNNRSFSSYIVARFILSSDKKSIKKETSWFERFISNCECEDLVKAFLLYATNFKYYDNFWEVWKIFYDAIIRKQKHYYDDETLNTYLLNPFTDKPLEDNWFVLIKENVNFYNRVAHDLGDNPTVLKVISNVTTTIGKNYYLDFVDIIYYIITTFENLYLGELKTIVLIYLEKIVRRINNEEQEKLRSNQKFKKEYVTILNFMVKNDSSYASILRNSLI